MVRSAQKRQPKRPAPRKPAPPVPVVVPPNGKVSADVAFAGLNYLRAVAQDFCNQLSESTKGPVLAECQLAINNVKAFIESNAPPAPKPPPVDLVDAESGM